MTRRPINVLYVNTPQVTGGAEISLLTAIAALDLAYCRPFLLTTPGSMLIEQARANGIEPFTLDFPWLSRKRPWPYLNSIRGLINLIRNLDIDLVHTNCDHALPYVRRACRLTGKPYVSHVRDFVRDWFSESNLIALQGARRVIANSMAVENECVHRGVAPSRVSTIYNPVDLDRFQFAGDDLRKELGLSGENLVVGIIGQLQAIKGYREFVEAAFDIVGLLPETTFLLVGRPPDNDGRELERELRARIDHSPYAGAFHLLGHREDIDRVLRTVDVLAIPSWSESFGRVAVEGMAAGKSVIGSNVGGLPEIITKGVDGLLIPPRDTGALRDAIMILLYDPALRLRLGSNARLSVERFSVAHHVERLQTLYDEVLGVVIGAALGVAI